MKVDQIVVTLACLWLAACYDWNASPSDADINSDASDADIDSDTVPSDADVDSDDGESSARPAS